MMCFSRRLCNLLYIISIWPHFLARARVILSLPGLVSVVVFAAALSLLVSVAACFLPSSMIRTSWASFIVSCNYSLCPSMWEKNIKARAALGAGCMSLARPSGLCPSPSSLLVFEYCDFLRVTGRRSRTWDRVEI